MRRLLQAVHLSVLLVALILAGALPSASASAPSPAERRQNAAAMPETTPAPDLTPGLEPNEPVESEVGEPGQIAFTDITDDQLVPVPVPVDDVTAKADGQDTFCLSVYTGTVRSTWRISNPAGVTGVSERTLANFEQRIISQGPTFMDVELTSRAVLNTNAPFPVVASSLPADVLPYLQPESMIQSDHPEIVLLAQSLTSGTRTQAEAVEAVQAWVRSQVAYDYSVTVPNDALSVLRNRSAVCSGFSRLTIALLRAAGIPASYYIGCAAWYGPQGGLHAWIEIYYPDTGWVVSEPQTSANYLHAAGYIMGMLGLCGQSDTTITQINITYENSRLISFETPYTNQNSFGLNVASVPGVERRSVSVSPAKPIVSVSQAAPTGKVSFWVKSLECRGEDWLVEPAVSWLGPAWVQGLSAGTATLNVSAAGLAPGRHQGSIKAYPSAYGGDNAVSVPVDLWVTKLSVTGGGPWIFEYGVAGTDALPLGWPSLNTTPRVLGDVNGDGLRDLVGFGQTGVYVSLSNGSGFNAPQLWVRNYGTAVGGWTDLDTFPRMLGDVNGDRKADIVAFGNRATYVSLSTGSSFGAPTVWIQGYGLAAGGWTSQDLFPRMVADVNGDNKADIVAFGNRATYVSLSSGSSFGPAAAWIAGYGVAAGGWTSQDIFPRLMADANGDGRADIIAFGNRATYVSFSTGSSFGPPAVWIGAYGPAAGGWTTQTSFPRMLADMNGDGRADILAFGNAATYVSLSSGSSFAAPIEWLRSYGPAAGGWSDQSTYPRLAGDVTGDGKADVVGLGHVATFVSASTW